MRQAVMLVVTCLLIGGCAKTPTMYAEDGAALAFAGNTVRYSNPGHADVLCRYNKRSEVWDCDDGTSSTLTLVGLPFVGATSADFAGHRFMKPQPVR